jgi:hypothetical protein
VKDKPQAAAVPLKKKATESENPSDQKDNTFFSQACQTRTETPNSQENKYPPFIYAHQKHVRKKTIKQQWIINAQKSSTCR